MKKYMRQRLIECSPILMVMSILVKERVREWFQRFKNGDFHVEYRHIGEREKVFEDYKALLNENSCVKVKKNWHDHWELLNKQF